VTFFDAEKHANSLMSASITAFFGENLLLLVFGQGAVEKVVFFKSTIYQSVSPVHRLVRRSLGEDGSFNEGGIRVNPWLISR
jgi:hypothetical protein